MKKYIKHSKKVVHHSHHIHLKRRLILEIIGFAVLVPLLWRERSVIGEGVEALRSSDILYLGVAFAIYWAMQPFTALSLRLISNQNISITNATITKIAGSGPGRIIPGGLGGLSLDVLHLKKSKARVVHNHALSIVATHQIIAVIVNALIVLSILLFHDNFRNYLSSLFTTSVALSLVVVSLLLVSLSLWLHHLRNTRKRIVPVERYIRRLLFTLSTHPKRASKIVLLSLLTIFAHSALLVLCSLSLGVSMSLWDGIIAMSSGVLIGSIVPTPGGIGVVEAGVTASLIALGYDPAHAAGVAILFRVVTYWLPLFPGTLAYFYLVDRKII